MRAIRGRLLVGAGAAALLLGQARSALASEPCPPPVRYTLSNGLDVYLEEDHRQPLLALRVSYGVGEGNDPKGQKGLAHLVEHLTFRGSRHLDEGQYWTTLERAGASGINGTTDVDRTSYFAVLPAQALELGLWLESERMGFTVERFDKRRFLLEQRTVREEERLRVDQHGAAFEILLSALLGPDHPYASPLDRMSTTENMTLSGAQAFFLDYYRPNNARLVVIGDFRTADARRWVDEYFSALKGAKIPILRAPSATAKPAQRLKFVHQTLTREVAMAWRVPRSSLRETARLELLMRAVLGYLNPQLKTDATAVSSISWSCTSAHLASLCSINALLASSGKHRAVAAAVTDAFATLAEHLQQSDLNQVRLHAELNWLESWEDLSSRALTQEAMMELLQHPIARDDYYRELEAVTLEEVRALVPLFADSLTTSVDTVSGRSPIEGLVSSELP